MPPRPPPPPPPPPPGAPPPDTPWQRHDDPTRWLGLDDESDGREDEDEALEWSRGDKLITDDGSITARRLSRGQTEAAEGGGKAAKPGMHDDVVLELRGDVPSASFFCAADPAAEAALAQQPLSRVLLALSRDESGLWSECTRGLAPGDTVCFRCAASRAPRWLQAFASCCLLPGPDAHDDARALLLRGTAGLPRPDSSALDAALARLSGGTGGSARAAGVAIEVRLVGRRAVRSCAATTATAAAAAGLVADSPLWLRTLQLPTPRGAPPQPPDLLRLECSDGSGEGEGEGGGEGEGEGGGGGGGTSAGDGGGGPTSVRLALTIGHARGVLGAAIPWLHVGATYELEAHALCTDDEAGGCVPAPPSLAALLLETPPVQWPPPPRLLRLRVSGVEAQQALLPDLSEVVRTLEPGQGSVRPGDLFEAELHASPCDAEGTPAAPPSPLLLSLSGPGVLPTLRRLAGAASEVDGVDDEVGAADEAARAVAALERCARRMLRQESCLLRVRGAPLALMGRTAAASHCWRLTLARCVRVVHLDAAPLDAPLVASGGGVCGGAGSGRSGGGGGSELVAKRCVSAQDLERLEASVLSPAMFGMNLLGSEQPVMDDFTVVLRARALLPPCPHAADADAADAGAGAGPLAAPLRVVAGAAELGVAWEPLLSSLAYRGETAVFEASGPTAAALGAGLDKAQAQAAAAVTAATAAEGGTHCGDERGRSGESAHGGSEAVGGCNDDEEEETARAHEWAGLVFGPTAAEASALAARGVRQFGVQVLDIIAPPDKRDASAATQLAYLRALRRRAARLFSEGQPALSACKWRRLLWMLQDLPAASIFNPDAPAEELLPSPLVFSHALRGGDRGDRGDGGEGGVGEGLSEGCEGGGEGKGGKSSAEELNELWRAGALGVAACALRQQQYALAQAACRCVVKQCPACADAHVRLAHALYAERHLDGAVESLCTAVRLRPSHKEARELHAHIVRLRSQLRSREASRSREAFKKMMG